MVEWKPIESLGEFFGGLTGKSKEDFDNGNAKFITYMNVFANPSLKKDCVDMVRINEDEKQNIVKKGDILFSGSSETPEEAGMSCVVTEDLEEDYYLNSFCFGLRLLNPEQYNLHYFKHLLRSYNIRKAISKTASGVTRFNISKARFGKVLIPIPNLVEQNRIVDILDTFTSTIDNLWKQVALRRKQFEYYQNQLLDNYLFNATVNEVASFGEGRILYSELNEYNYISVENLLKDKGGKTISSVVPTTGNWPAYLPNDILIGNIRPYLRKIWMANISGGTNGDVVVVRPNTLIQPRFLYYTLSSERFFVFYNQTAKGGKMPRGDKKRLLDFEIFLPHISEQKRIVSIFDTFEASIKNLEAQLELRQKQYEYYRNKLLTFE